VVLLQAPPFHFFSSNLLIHGPSLPDDDDDVYYPKGRKPREDEEGEESYEPERNQSQSP
jgi:hypothetical protein